ARRLQGPRDRSPPHPPRGHRHQRGAGRRVRGRCTADRRPDLPGAPAHLRARPRRRPPHPGAARGPQARRLPPADPAEGGRGMNGALAALATTIGILGLLVIVLGILPAPVPQGPKPPSRLQLAFLEARGRFGKQRMMLAGAGFIGGVILWLFTGWIVWIVIVPLAAVGVPWLLSSGGEQRKLDRLEGLETWTRGLAGLTVAGSSL